jgi:hypothetical protein
VKDLVLEPMIGTAWSSSANEPNSQGHQCCSSFLGSCPPQNVLIVGAERSDEFADALWMICLGHSVTVVNPRETLAAREFKRKGGTFIQGRVEELPLACRCFVVICENYPYPSGQHYVPPTDFAEARLSRLSRGGRWILFTEAVRFATLLKAVADFDENLPGKFSCAMSRMPLYQAPPSTYPPGETRFRLIFTRVR